VQLQIDFQIGPVADETRSKFAICSAIIKGFLFSLKRERVNRLGGYEKVTLWDIARETRTESDGDCGVCLEYALHDSIAQRNQQIWPIVSQVLNDHCKIKDGAHSILFGAEKSGYINYINSNAHYINPQTRILHGTPGKPVYLERYMDVITKSVSSAPSREKLPQSIKGLWRADLFVGSPNTNQWVGTTLKINRDALVGDVGLRIGMYPEKRRGEAVEYNDKLNLIMCPLPYDGHFMESYYKSYNILRAIIHSDCNMPSAVFLPDSGDRYIASELIARKNFPAIDISEALFVMGQPGLINSSPPSEETILAVAPVVLTQ